PAGATTLGAADRDDAASHLELLGGAFAEGPGHGQEDQDQMMEVPATIPAWLLEAASSLLPDLRSEKLPQARGHRSGVTSRALRRQCPCHKPFLLIGLGEISQFDSERLVLSHSSSFMHDRFGIACHPPAGRRLAWGGRGGTLSPEGMPGAASPAGA